MSISQSQSKFREACLRKQQLKCIPYLLQQKIMFMDYKINKENKSFTLMLICGGRSRQNFKVEKNYQRAFLSLKSEEKVEYFCETIDLAYEAEHSISELSQSDLKLDLVTFHICLIKGEKETAPIKVILKGFRIVSDGNNMISLDIKEYLIRKSKKKNKSCYVLEALKKGMSPETVRFSFVSYEQQCSFYPLVQTRFHQSRRLVINKEIMEQKIRRKISNNAGREKNKSIGIKIEKFESSEQQSELTIKPIEQPQHVTNRTHISKKTICEEMIKSLDQQNLDEDFTEMEEQIVKKNNQVENNKFSLRLFRSMAPFYALETIDSLLHFGAIYESQLTELFVYRNITNRKIHKIQMNVQLPATVVSKALYNVQLQKFWHPQIQQGQVTMKITSQNSCVVYLKQKPYSQWYRSRDYLILIHSFTIQDSLIIVGKSIENGKYPPFQSITRGKVDYFVWKIQQCSGSVSKIAGQILIDHEGVLNQKHQEQLTYRYLKGFEFLESYFIKQKNSSKLQEFLSTNWIIHDDPMEQSVINSPDSENPLMISLKTVDFEEGSEYSIEQSKFYSIEIASEEEKEFIKQIQSDEESEHQLNESNVVLQQRKMLLNSQILGKSRGQETIMIGENGLISLPKNYLSKKHIMEPFAAEPKRISIEYKNMASKNDWEIQKTGGLKLVNSDKIEAQKNVSKYIIKTMKNNLFSGKGALSISLPVEIFNSDSNLQRLSFSLGLAPDFLEKATNMNPIERFKQCIAFGLSTFIFFFDIDKPFNPILGETYQGFIQGCPIYAEQISHHPPISSVYFIGRGYKISGSLEGKVSMGMNSGEGVNEGLLKIEFQDGSAVKFQAPPAQISGVSMGEIKYNFKGKGYFFDEMNQLFCQMKMEDDGGYFSKKKRDFKDQITGTILKVQPKFLKEYLSSKASPKPSYILQNHGELGGRWPYNLKINQKVYYDVEEDLPYELKDDIYPLPSNSNYREDLYYRRLEDLSKSQLQKQRLEGIQRGDKKMRQKIHGKKH